MKPKLATVALVAATVLSAIGAEETPEALPLVFVSQQTLDASRLAGNLKENTLYWSNETNDPRQGASTEKEKDGQAFLVLKGTGDEKTPRAQTEVKVLRIVNIPAGAKKAEISAEAKLAYDEWADNGTRPKNPSPALSYWVAKPNKEGRPRALNLPQPNAEGWTQTSAKLDIPEGAQQLILQARTDFPYTLSLAAINATFDGAAQTKPAKTP